MCVLHRLYTVMTFWGGCADDKIAKPGTTVQVCLSAFVFVRL